MRLMCDINVAFRSMPAFFPHAFSSQVERELQLLGQNGFAADSDHECQHISDVLLPHQGAHDKLATGPSARSGANTE